jgi:hypothetical protein
VVQDGVDHIMAAMDHIQHTPAQASVNTQTVRAVQMLL